MFVISQNPKFKTNVEVWMQNEKGVPVKSTFKAIFNRVKTSELEGWQNSEQTTREFLKAKLVGWEDLTSDAGDQVEFSPANLEILLEMPEAVQGLSKALSASIHIQKEKN